MTFLWRISVGKLSGFHNSMMVGPGYFQTVRQKLNGLRARGSEDQKTSSGGTEASNHPKNIFHRVAPLVVLTPQSVSTMRLGAWMPVRVEALLVG
jgi:hypothetical protein